MQSPQRVRKLFLWRILSRQPAAALPHPEIIERPAAVPAAMPVPVVEEAPAAVMKVVLPVAGLALPSPASNSVQVPAPHLLAGAFLTHWAPELHVGVPDVALELLLVGLAQDRLLVGLR